MTKQRARVGRFIGDLMHRHRITQKYIAKEIGVTAMTVSNWRRNKRTPYLEHWRALLRLKHRLENGVSRIPRVGGRPIF